MSRTVSRAKNRSQEALRQLLRGVHWSHFVSPVIDKPRIVSRGGIAFTARYGYFLKITGVGIFADDKMVRFVPCFCPLRNLDGPDLKSNILNGGGFHLVAADILYKKRHHQYQHYMIRRAKEGSRKPSLLAWKSVLAPIEETNAS